MSPLLGSSILHEEPFLMEETKEPLARLLLFVERLLHQERLLTEKSKEPLEGPLLMENPKEALDEEQMRRRSSWRIRSPKGPLDWLLYGESEGVARSDPAPRRAATP